MVLSLLQRRGWQTERHRDREWLCVSVFLCLQPAQPSVKRHVQDGHETHVCESNDEQHQEGNGWIVFVLKRIENDQSKIHAKAKLEDGKDTCPTQIFLCEPTACFVLDAIFRCSLEAALDSKKRLHHSFRITHRQSDSHRHQKR